MKTKNKNLKRNILRTLIVLASVSFVSYAYAITSATVEISSSKSLNKNNQELQTEIAALEIEYFEVTSSMNIEQAQTEGYVEAEEIFYAKRNAESRLAFNY